ncbi:hypothetical protein HK098_006976 [Nowakowskiella sp. JEL0407]|nr:hypothetical protein HK098_006976 [Nowakowskiella sp. JEL0407]
MQAFRRLWLTTNFPWRRAKYVGTDLDNNMYFEMPSLTSSKPRRKVEYLDGRDHRGYDPDSIPIQWQSWLRNTRDDAPTIQELIESQRYSKYLSERGQELEREYQAKKLQLEEQRQELLNSPNNNADVKSEIEDAKEKTRWSPEGQGETFSPGTWNPSVRRK